MYLHVNHSMKSIAPTSWRWHGWSLPTDRTKTQVSTVLSRSRSKQSSHRQVPATMDGGCLCSGLAENGKQLN